MKTLKAVLLVAERLRSKEALLRAPGQDSGPPMQHAVLADDGFALGSAFTLQVGCMPTASHALPEASLLLPWPPCLAWLLACLVCSRPVQLVESACRKVRASLTPLSWLQSTAAFCMPGATEVRHPIQTAPACRGLHVIAASSAC